MKYALIGCGRIANRHSELLGGNQIKGAELVAVCDIDIKKAENIGKKYEVNFYSNLDSMFENNEIDIAVILTDSGSHYDVFKSIQKYKKHVIVEKPMALKLEYVQLI